MIIIIILFALVGLYILTGRGSFLIAGYNFMPEAEKAKYNEKRLCQFMGIFMLISAVLFLFMEYELLPLYFIIIAYLIITFTFIFLVNVSNFFKIRK
ncbi:DUF3784 domain-containing protein [Macrococcus animalis]|uniref:DUF3784 domain-containing protein n=1 Tax=Macrococcus animalis TaxID=3395467 RepID=UPI0039BDFA38